MLALARLERRDIADLVLPDGVADELVALLEEYQFRTELARHKLAPRSRVLLHGPPGCGKSSLAAALGAAMGRPAFTLQLAEANGPHVGETARNIHAAVAHVQRATGLLLLDELDSIGARRTSRDDQAAAREQNAIVCALLQVLDQTSDTIIVGATNRADILDPALRRRFDIEFELPLPTSDAAQAFAEEVFARHAWPMPKGWVPPVTSFDAVEKAALTTIRAAVISAARASKQKGSQAPGNRSGGRPGAHEGTCNAHPQ
jgi:SpoVK/Ycf46/Vps4 family AAA+-type ATPase